MTRDTVLNKLSEFITENFLYMRPDFTLQETDSLMANGIVDSMGVMEVMMLLEEEFEVKVPDEDITEENLGTMAAIADYVMAQRATPDLRSVGSARPAHD